MRAAVFIVALALAACRQAPAHLDGVDPDNPFLRVTLAQFQMASADAVVKKDVSALANNVFLLKRELPVAWVATVDAGGTVLMHSDPRMIAVVPNDALSQESLAYRETEPMIRPLMSADRRPVMDFTLPLFTGEGGKKAHAGYVRVGFFSGPAGLPWTGAAPTSTPTLP